ncbi:MAG: hypothetical protein QOH93_3308, partial [Chloroflexia bacterium]|nr:hypothetical protein [Chloroflexia bacterium]
MLKIRNIALILGFALVGAIMVVALRSVTNTGSPAQPHSAAAGPERATTTSMHSQVEAATLPTPALPEGQATVPPPPGPGTDRFERDVPVVGQPIDLKVERPETGTTLNVTSYLSQEQPNQILGAYRDKVSSVGWTLEMESQEGLVFAYPRGELEPI